jgi:hypothetical protein
MAAGGGGGGGGGEGGRVVGRRSRRDRYWEWGDDVEQPEVGSSGGGPPRDPTKSKSARLPEIREQITPSGLLGPPSGHTAPSSSACRWAKPSHPAGQRRESRRKKRSVVTD